MSHLPSLENLQCFERAARLLNFRKAARAVGLTPAAFGQRIRKLEDQIGSKLFVRTTRAVHLTDAGAALREPVERCLRMAEETVRAARGDTTPPPMELVLGTRYELGIGWVLPQIERLEKARPWLQLHLYFGSGQDLLLRVRALEIDCATTSTRFNDPKLDFLRLHRIDYVFCASSSLLAKKPFRRAADAANHTLVDVSAELPLLRHYKDALESTELHFERIVRLGSHEAVRRRLLAGAGVAVLPEFMIRADLKNGKLRRVLTSVEPAHDYLRLVFRADDPRRPILEGLAASLMQTPL